MASMPVQGMAWVTCDREAHRADLLASFMRRFPSRQHVVASGAGYDSAADGSVVEFLAAVYALGGGKPGDGQGMLHLTAMESYLRLVGGSDGSMQIELRHAATWEGVVQPFVPMVWSGSYCWKEFGENAPAFQSRVVHFHFDSEPLGRLHMHVPTKPRSRPAGGMAMAPSNSLLAYIDDRLAELRAKGNQRGILAGLADAYRSLGRSGEEVIHREALLALIPEEEARHRADQLFWIANCHWRLGDLERARHFFQWSVDTAGPDISDGHNHARVKLAQVLKELGRDKEADRHMADVALSSKSLGDSIAFMSASTYFARSHMEQGKYDEGIATLRMGLEELYRDHEYGDLELGLCELARYYLVLGRTEEAVLALKRAYNLNRKYAWDPHRQVLSMMAFALLQLDPVRSEEARMSLYDNGFRMGLSKVDGSLFKDMSDYD